MNPTILTHQGSEINFEDSFNNVYNIEDIAHALSNLCRFTGHTREFYSVAEHSYYVSTIVPPQHALAGLLHDAAEAYLGDVSSPLKALLPDYKTLERQIEMQIFQTFDLPASLPAEVKHADLVMVATEKRDLMPVTANQWPGLAARGIHPRADLVIRPWPPGQAKAFFLARFKELTT